MEATSGVVGVGGGNVVGRWLKTDVWAFTGILCPSCRRSPMAAASWLESQEMLEGKAPALDGVSLTHTRSRAHAHGCLPFRRMCVPARSPIGRTQGQFEATPRGSTCVQKVLHCRS